MFHFIIIKVNFQFQNFISLIFFFLFLFLFNIFYFCRYIFSLALADLLVIIICVPLTSLVYTLESWPWGSALCRVTECAKDISIGVSVFTLTALSAERYYAIVNPLRKLQVHNMHFHTLYSSPLFCYFVSSSVYPIYIPYWMNRLNEIFDVRKEKMFNRSFRCVHFITMFSLLLLLFFLFPFNFIHIDVIWLNAWENL